MAYGFNNDRSKVPMYTKDDIDNMSFNLEPATQSTLGGVMVDGTTIAVDQNGVISVALQNGDNVNY